MKIYTKTGDRGFTSLLGGKRVSKSDIRIDAYGVVDELNAYVGLLRDQEVNKKRTVFLESIQDRLFTIGSTLALAPGMSAISIPSLEERDVEALEAEIDIMEEALVPMKSFILPGGHPSVSFGHVARTVCRRAERAVLKIEHVEHDCPCVLSYLNRLSDYFFVLCRKMTDELKVKETPWRAKI